MVQKRGFDLEFQHIIFLLYLIQAFINNIARGYCEMI